MHNGNMFFNLPFSCVFFILTAISAAVIIFFGIRYYYHKKQQSQDSLTGLSNREVFLKQAGRALSSSDSIPAAFLFFGLDHVSEVNERLGHETGDQVIRSTSLSLRKSFRQKDLIGRFGSDKFMVLIKNVPEFILIMRLKQILNYLQVEYGSSTEHVSVTSSIGVIYFTDTPEQNMQQLLEMADLELHRAKEAGRNCYSIREL